MTVLAGSCSWGYGDVTPGQILPKDWADEVASKYYVTTKERITPCQVLPLHDPSHPRSCQNRGVKIIIDSFLPPATMQNQQFPVHTTFPSICCASSAANIVCIANCSYLRPTARNVSAGSLMHHLSLIARALSLPKCLERVPDCLLKEGMNAASGKEPMNARMFFMLLNGCNKLL